LEQLKYFVRKKKRRYRIITTLLQYDYIMRLQCSYTSKINFHQEKIFIFQILWKICDAKNSVIFQKMCGTRWL